jgi:ketosteroid isomerase-like protein
MSRARQNVELVQSILAEWERGDFFRSAEWADPGMTFVIADGPAAGGWTGLRAIVQSWQQWLDAWSNYRIESAECHAVDGERVLALIRVSGVGRASGFEVAEMDGKGAAVFTVREERVKRLVTYTERVYFTRDQALADLGLAPGSEEGT